MLKRRRFLLLALVLLLAATFFLPPVYWRVVGWVNGEAVYDGRPTSWWEREILIAYEPVLALEHEPPTPNVLYYSWERETAPGWNRFLPKRFQLAIRHDVNPPLVNRDHKALPVLMELLHRSDRKIRLLALSGLGELGAGAEGCLLDIQEACNDPDQEIRFTANRAAGKIEHERRKCEE